MTDQSALYTLLGELGFQGPPLTMDGLAKVVAKASPKPGTLRFDQAEVVGLLLHDHWLKLTGEAPTARDDPMWADLTQFVIRAAREVVDGR